MFMGTKTYSSLVVTGHGESLYGMFLIFGDYDYKKRVLEMTQIWTNGEIIQIKLLWIADRNRFEGLYES